MTTSAIDDGVLSGQGYLFWDTVHPTTAIQELIGNTAFAMVPEPSSITLMLGAGGVMIAFTKARLAAGRCPLPAGESVRRAVRRESDHGSKSLMATSRRTGRIQREAGHITRSSAQGRRRPVLNSLYSASVGRWIVRGS